MPKGTGRLTITGILLAEAIQRLNAQQTTHRFETITMLPNPLTLKESEPF